MVFSWSIEGQEIGDQVEDKPNELNNNLNL